MRDSLKHEGTTKGEGTTRRRFLLYAWAVSALVLVGEALGMLVKFFQPRARAGGFGSKIVAGKLNEFPKGSTTYIEAGYFFITHLEGGFLAQYRACPHLGCIVSWVEDDGQFNCPCHAGVFNQEGEVLAGPVPRPLDLFPIEIVDGELVVDTGKPILRKQFEESQLAQV